MKIVELILNEEDDLYGIEAVSVVENPAIEENFIALKKQEVQLKTIDTEKRILMGAALVPKKQIYRRDEKSEDEYYIYFSSKTIRRASQLFLKNSNQNNATIEHEEDLTGMSVVESWIVEDKEKDKSALYGFDVPVGTWMIAMKVENNDVWEKVKAGEIKGFSIEGYFAEKIEASKIEIPTINLKEPCWKGYEMIGYKIKDGKKVPNCVPIENSTELESYADYPSGVKNNAKRGIELNEKNNNKCATQTGKVRAQQLAKGEAISVSTIKRMYSYLSRAETYYDKADTNDCGNISYLLWGGKAALRWSKSKLKELDKLEQVQEELNKELVEELKSLILDYEKENQKKNKN